MLKPGDKVVMNDHYHVSEENRGKVWMVRSEPWVCCGCPISYKAVEDLEKIRPYEPNVVKAAYNIFGKSYAYREKYNAYKKQRMEEERKKAACPQLDGQMMMEV